MWYGGQEPEGLPRRGRRPSSQKMTHDDDYDDDDDLWFYCWVTWRKIEKQLGRDWRDWRDGRDWGSSFNNRPTSASDDHCQERKWYTNFGKHWPIDTSCEKQVLIFYLISGSRDPKSEHRPRRNYEDNSEEIMHKFSKRPTYIGCKEFLIVAFDLIFCIKWPEVEKSIRARFIDYWEEIMYKISKTLVDRWLLWKAYFLFDFWLTFWVTWPKIKKSSTERL